MSKQAKSKLSQGANDYNRAIDIRDKYYNKKADPRGFFEELITAILMDFKMHKESEYLKAIVDKDQKIFYIEYGVINELYSRFVTGNEPHFYSDVTFVPWSSFSFILPEDGFKETAVYGLINPKQTLESKLREIANKNPDDLYYPIDRKLRDYDESSDRKAIIDRAKKDADNIRIQAESYRTKLQEEADDKKREAEFKADDIIREAESKADDIIREAEFKADDITKEARGKAEKEIELEAKKIIEEKLSDYRQMIQDTWSDTKNASYNGCDYQTIYDAKIDLCNETDKMKFEWRTEMMKAVESLKTAQEELEQKIRSAQNDMDDKMHSIQNELESKVRNWQGSLFHHELQALADCYGGFYRIVNMNKCLNNYILRDDSDDLPGSTLEDLKRLQTSLSVNLKKLEDAMKPLGLKVFTPKIGDPYDDVFHENISGDCLEDPYGCVIDKCVTPGISKVGSGDYEDEPIVRAIVKLRPKGGAEGNGTF